MKCFQTFDLHNGSVSCLKFNPDDLTLVSGSADKTVKYWDLQEFGLVSYLDEFFLIIKDLDFKT